MYNHQEIEKKWQDKWTADNLYATTDSTTKPKYYVLDMFPYPSGAGLHVGHPRGYIATDVVARYKMLKGFNVLHPMGWDAFGLPAENYALANKLHPKIATDQNIATYKRQLKLLGFTYDWSREINTTDSAYYKWTQWAFAEMFKRGLVYESHEPINWCPTCLTGLANEDVEDGKCERCGTIVEKKPLRQWVIRITDYAERLLNDLAELKDWDENVKDMQRNWIGKSNGATIRFQVTSHKSQVISESQKSKDSVIPGGAERRSGIQESTDENFIEVFTTRPDTIFGATYMVMAPELIMNYELRITNYDKVRDYVNKVKNKSDLERTDLNKDKTGVELQGIKAINPATNEEIPIWVADYVLPNYGTGAIMAVPAHDERDHEFAQKYDLPIRIVVEPPALQVFNRNAEDLAAGAPADIRLETDFWLGEGKSINSSFLDGLETPEAKDKIIAWLEEKKIGERKVNYKLKDWVFSRQRYWGEPLPLVYCESCKKRIEEYKKKNNIDTKVLSFKSQVLSKQEFSLGELINPGWMEDNNLPLKLPEVESYEPSGTGESPLATIKDWVKTTCPKCGGEAKRETNTMPQWAGSSWYYLAYIMRGVNSTASSVEQNTRLPRPSLDSGLAMTEYKKSFHNWLPVDCYVGGAEHITRHMIYARFWHKFLYDVGVVDYLEPFAKYRSVGLILAGDGRKMSKRWHNVINPDEIVISHGADALRVYEMFMGPFGEAIAWNTNGLSGARKFLDKVYRLKSKVKSQKSEIKVKGQKFDNKEIKNLLHKTIRKVGEDIEAFKFNTAISALMILVNKMNEAEAIEREDFACLLQLLAPFAPHLAAELWDTQMSGESIFASPWPKFDPTIAQDEVVNLVVQINGKLRATIEVPADIAEDEAKALALNLDKIKPWLEGKTVEQVIFVKGRLVNIVIS